MPPAMIHRSTTNAPSRQAGAFLFLKDVLQDVPKEEDMFEGQPQEEVEALMTHPEFKRLYQRHKQLDKQVLDAELGVLPIDDTTLGQMKREKLLAKDRLTRLYEVLHH